jgi:hypothetical protein
MKKNIIAFFALLYLLPFFMQAESPITPLKRNQYTKVSSHDELLSYMQVLASLSKRLVVDTIGRSVQGRPIPLVHVKPIREKDNIRVLLFCQQHGNEPSGKEAALELLNQIASDDKNVLYQHLDLYVIPSSNPDGNESGKRANANKEDLNRDHLLLSQPETQAIHAAFARIQPEVILDVHEFSAYRKEFLASGYVRAVDEQFGAPTNLNIPFSIREYGLKRLFPFLDLELSKQNLRFANYLKMDEPNDTVRPSTTSIDDGRQSFAILNTFSFILEGKNGRSFDDELKRRTESQVIAIEAFLRFVDQNASEIQSLILFERKKILKNKESVIVKMDYQYTGKNISLPMRTISAGSDTTVSMKYAPDVQSLLSVTRPKAYLIPQSQSAIIEILQRHGVQMERIKTSYLQEVEKYTITDIAPVWMENKPFINISTQVKNGSVTAQSGDYLVSLSQPTSTMIVITLEPSSMWGLVQNENFSALRIPNSVYPIYRITK